MASEDNFWVPRSGTARRGCLAATELGFASIDHMDCFEQVFTDYRPSEMHSSLSMSTLHLLRYCKTAPDASI